MLVDREWGVGNGGDEGDEGDEEEELITKCNSQCLIPYSLLPTPQLSNALIIGKKRGKLLTASIIEFDLLFNAYA